MAALRLTHNPQAQPRNTVLRLGRREGEILSVPRPTPGQLQCERAFLDGIRTWRRRILYVCELDVEEFFHRFRFRHPEIFWLDRKYYVVKSTLQGIYAVQPSYLYTREQVQELQRRMDATLTEIHEELRGCREPFERIRRIYDWFILNTRYLDDGRLERFSAVGPLCERAGVCMGLSMAFMLACQREGISCGMVTGSADLEQRTTHCWNIVKLGGAVYHIDLTAGLSYYRAAQAVAYPVFMLPESELARSRYIETPSGEPESQEYKYTRRVGQCFRSEREIQRWVECSARPGTFTLSGDPDCWPSNESFQTCALRCITQAGLNCSYTQTEHFVIVVKFP